MNTQEIVKINWRLIVSFKTEILSEYLIQSNLAYAQSLLALPQSKRLIVDNDIYLDQEEAAMLEGTIEKDVSLWAKNLFGHIESTSKTLLKRSYTIGKYDIKSSSDQELLEMLNFWLEQYGATVSLIGFPARLDEVLEQALRADLGKYDIEDLEAVFRMIAHSDQWTSVFEEKLALMKAVLDGSISEEWVMGHVHKYAGITKTLLLGDLYSTQKVEEKIDELKQDKDLQKKYDTLANNVTENKREVIAIIKRYDFSSDTRTLISLFRHAIWFRTARLEWLNESCALAHSLLEETAKRIRVSYEELIYHFPDEIFQSLQLNKSVIQAEELKQRLTKYAMATVDGKNTDLFLDANVDELKQSLVPFSSPKTEVKGMIAYPGLVRGKVKILKDRSEMHKIVKGDVLVTKLTTPDFVPAMEKAIAIVTDLGGITSHAAIVSRELHIPCIVGTGNATSTLQENDEVEVDANNGVVRILN